VVNNAGADVLTGEAAAWEWERKLDALLAVDLKGTIACSYAAGEVMCHQERGGTIVNMSWDHVTIGMVGDDPQLFSAVKGGVLAFSKSLARSLAPAVRVNVLCPGWIETSFAEQADRKFHRSVAEATPPAAGPPAPPRRRPNLPRRRGQHARKGLNPGGRHDPRGGLT
jgi:3-oxoacyl-[acyl-carrier protein] reductase